MDCRLDQPQNVSKCQVGRRVVNRVAAENQQCVHLAGGHFIDQRADGRNVRGPLRIRQPSVGYGIVLAHISQQCVDAVYGRMGRGRLARADTNDALAPVLRIEQIAGHRAGKPSHTAGGFDMAGRFGWRDQFPFKHRHKRGNLCRSQRKPMIGRGARQGDTALDHVQSVHWPRLRRPPLGKIAGVAHRRWRRIQ